MGRILSFLVLVLLLSGCPNFGNPMQGGAKNGAYENRPSSGSEGVIGYIVKPSSISITANALKGTITVSAPANTVSNGTKDASDVLVTVYNPLEAALKDFVTSRGEGRMRADFLEGNYAKANGAFSVTFSGFPKKFLLVAVDQEPGLNEVSVQDVANFERPMYVLMVRKDNGTYQDAASLIKEMLDGWIIDFCSKPEIKPYCDAAILSR